MTWYGSKADFHRLSCVDQMKVKKKGGRVFAFRVKLMNDMT